MFTKVLLRRACQSDGEKPSVRRRTCVTQMANASVRWRRLSLRRRTGASVKRRTFATQANSDPLEFGGMSRSRALKQTLDLVASMQQRHAKASRLPVQLPLWSERVRGLPNALARCALFTASSPRMPRTQYARTKIVSLQGAIIEYTGEELRQDDQDVFLQIVHLGRACPAGEFFVASGHQILVALGWGRGADRYDRLKATIGRLFEGSVWVTREDGRAGYAGRLIDRLEWLDESGEGVAAKWRFRLDPKIVTLFGSDSFSLIDWEQRLSLGTLEKWLHSFYFTHRAPYAYKVEKLYELCGSKVKQLRQFRYMLKAALQSLCDVGFLESFSIDSASDLVSVRRRSPNVLPA